MYAVYKQTHRAQLPTRLRSTAPATCAPSILCTCVGATHLPPTLFPLACSYACPPPVTFEPFYQTAEASETHSALEPQEQQFSSAGPVSLLLNLPLNSRSRSFGVLSPEFAVSVVFLSWVRVRFVRESRPVERIVNVREKYDIVRCPVTRDIRRQL